MPATHWIQNFLLLKSLWSPLYNCTLHTFSVVSCVSPESQYMPPYGWYLHTETSHPCIGHRCVPIPSQVLAFAPFADNWMVCSCLWYRELKVFFFFKNKLKRGFVWPANTFSLSFSPSDMSCRPRELLSVFALNWCMASSLCNGVSGCFSGRSGKLDGFPSTCGCIHHRTTTVSHVILSEGLKVKPIQQSFPSLANILDGEIKFFAIVLWQMFFLHWLTIL